MVWAERAWDCTGGFEPRSRVCKGLGNGPVTFAADCSSVFVAADSNCYTSAGHLQLGLVTPGLYS